MLQQKEAQKVPEGIARVTYTAREKWITPPIWRRASKQLASSACLPACLLCARVAWQPTKTHSLSLKTLPCSHTCWFYFSRMKSQALEHSVLYRKWVHSLAYQRPIPWNCFVRPPEGRNRWRKLLPLGLLRDKTRSPLPHVNSASSHITRWGWAVASPQTYEINRKQF